MSVSSINTLVWYRQDLRTYDHQPLTQACAQAKQTGGQVQALYIATPQQWQQHDLGARQLTFMEQHLNDLAEQLAALGIVLTVLHVDAFADCPQAVLAFMQQHQLSQLYAHQEVEVNERRRDQQVEQMLAHQGIACHWLQGSCLLPPLSVCNQAGMMFKVFTPFAKAARAQLQSQPNQALPQPPIMGESFVVDQPLVLYTAKKTLHETEHEALFKAELETGLDAKHEWGIGEQYALALLNEFVRNRSQDYQQARDFPAQMGTAKLSPYLALGVISPRQCLAAVLSHAPEIWQQPEHGAWTWITELLWRDFYRHLLVAFPRLSMGDNFNRKADGIVWRNDPQEFQAWCDGQTGYPIVDAAMRQLKQTGWMHNRLRMIVASFLTKHLLIDWRWGERYFRQQLLDGDLAANNGGWQWSAGTGCDAQPYFRVFSPMRQSEKFDPRAEFIYQFVPEIAHIPPKQVHTMSFVVEGYPQPIVEHGLARQRALTAYGIMKGG